MNLREMSLPLSCKVNGEKFEALFQQEVIAARYKVVTESEEYKSVKENVIDALEELGRSLCAGRGADKIIRHIASRETFEENLKFNVMSNAVNMAIEAIVFDGENTEQAIANVLTEEFMGMMLYEVGSMLGMQAERVFLASLEPQELFS